MFDKILELLNNHGLDQYVAAFQENAIEDHILPDLTDDDLKELGIKPLGHRKIILKSIAGSSKTKHQALDKMNDSPSDDDITAWSRTPGERKPVTMLFADIVESTYLTEKLDAEEAHDLLYRATQRMCQAVEENQGTVCRFMGDGIMAMFGAPLASERHALEACRAAFDMQTSIGSYSANLQTSHGIDLLIRVGLHSGEVVVLEVGDDPNRPEYDASGSVISLAARMEQSATPGKIQMSLATRALAGDLIEAGEQSHVRVKGVSEPMIVHNLNRIRSSAELATNFNAHMEFVGRRAELAQFRGILEECQASGHGQTIYLRGEPGIGKSRLVEEMTQYAQQKGFVRYKALVLDFGVGKGQEAMPSLVRNFLGIKQGSSKRDRQQAVAISENTGIAHPDQRVYLNDLLDLSQPLELRTLYEATDVAARIDGKRKSVVAILTRLAAIQPVLLVIEDLHWADADTLEYIARITAVVADYPILMILTSRLEGDPIDTSWRARAGEHPIVTWDLIPLRSEDALKLTAGLVDVDQTLVRRCIKRAEGNPLFLEQLLLSADSGSVEDVPDSIKSLVLARMDQLPVADKLALRAASVLGQRFDLHGLCYLIGDPEYDCHNLVDHHLIRPDGNYYLFAHALIQGGIYASLLTSQRNSLHAQAAKYYQHRDSILHAEHLDRADDKHAAEAYLKAAYSQSELYRPHRALQLVKRGLEIAGDSEQFDLCCVEGELLRILGDPFGSITAYRGAADSARNDNEKCLAWIGIAEGLGATGAHEEMLKVLHDTEVIANELNLPFEMARIYQIRGGVLFYRGEIEACLDANTASLKYARGAGSSEVEAQALSGLANAEYNRGRFLSAHGYFDQCIELARAQGFGRVIAANLSMRAYVTCWQNDIESAKVDFREAVEQANKTNDSRAEMLALVIGGSFWATIGEFDEARHWLNRGLKITQRMGFRLFEGVCHYLTGRFAMLQGNRQQALALAQKGVDILRESESGMTFGGPISLGVLALASDQSEFRRDCLAEADALLKSGSVGHNYLVFYEDAMETCLQMQDWNGVEKYAQALQDFTHDEPLPRSDFFIRRGRALSTYGVGNRDQQIIDELETLQQEANCVGLVLSFPSLQ